MPVSGMHGYFSDEPHMASSFFIQGPGIKAGKSRGRISMLDIVPTLANPLGVILPAAKEGAALTLALRAP